MASQAAIDREVNRLVNTPAYATTYARTDVLAALHGGIRDVLNKRKEVDTLRTSGIRSRIGDRHRIQKHVRYSLELDNLIKTLKASKS